MAKAQQGRLYAQIIDGKCHWLFTSKVLPEWNDTDVTAVDVTGLDVNVGDVWDGKGWKPAELPGLPQEPPARAGGTVVTPWQIRKALNQIGLRNAVEAAVATSDQETKDGWEFADEFRRDNALIASVAVALGKTDADIDALFALAMTL